jgi:hypothetical protein
VTRQIAPAEKLQETDSRPTDDLLRPATHNPSQDSHRKGANYTKVEVGSENSGFAGNLKTGCRDTDGNSHNLRSTSRLDTHSQSGIPGEPTKVGEKAQRVETPAVPSDIQLIKIKSDMLFIAHQIGFREKFTQKEIMLQYQEFLKEIGI